MTGDTQGYTPLNPGLSPGRAPQPTWSRKPGQPGSARVTGRQARGTRSLRRWKAPLISSTATQCILANPAIPNLTGVGCLLTPALGHLVQQAETLGLPG